MPQQCQYCNKWYTSLVMHWRRSKCLENAKLQQLSTIAESMYCHSHSLNVNDLSDNQMTDALAKDDCFIADLEFDCDQQQDGYFQQQGLDLGHVMPYQLPNNSSQKQLSQTVDESRAIEFMLEGIDDVFDEIAAENDCNVETESNLNVGYNVDDDVFTIQSEEPFFPLPLNNPHVAAMQQEQPATASDIATGTETAMTNENGTVYAPISMFEFKRVFTSEEYFMIKLCQICDKANVPHHIVDDVVDLLRECKQNNIKVQPELLRKRVHFLKHLENHFKSPIPQSIVIGLEGFSSNDIHYSRELRDSAEIIYYDFKEQALDLIHDIGIWGNLDNFKGTVDPKNPFSGQTPRTYGLLDEVIDGAWYKKTYAECKQMAGNEDFLVLGVILYCDKTGTDVYQRAGLEPLSFTFTIFNCECRYRSEAWCVLRYVPDIEMKSSADKAKQRWFDW